MPPLSLDISCTIFFHVCNPITKSHFEGEFLELLLTAITIIQNLNQETSAIFKLDKLMNVYSQSDYLKWCRLSTGELQEIV